MKKEYFYIVILSFGIVIVLWGIVSLLKTSYNRTEEMDISEVQNIYENQNTVPTDMEEEKISPNAEFALKKYYDECNHFEYHEAELPVELVNLTKQEVEDYYEEWDVEEFSPSKLVLSKEINGYCRDHYLVRLDAENMNVYHLKTSGDLELYKKTDVYREYLPESDVEKLEEGIAIYGEGNLSSVLEDFE